MTGGIELGFFISARHSVFGAEQVGTEAAKRPTYLLIVIGINLFFRVKIHF